MRPPDGEGEYAMIKGEPILILLADDDPAHSEAFRRALKASGMNVVIQPARTLKEYREIAAAHQPDIAILDLSLPDGRAVEVLISPPEAGPFPIMVITSQGDEMLAVEAMKAGALDYIVKSPEAFADMPRTVERVLHEWGMLQERKRAEEVLRESEERYRSLFDNANEAIFVVQGGKLVFCNPMTFRLMKYSTEEIRTKPFTEFVHPDDRDMVVERHLKRLRGEETPSLYSIRTVDGAGNTRWAEISAVLIKWEGKPATLNFALDITERKRAEEALRESEEKYRTLFDNAGEAIFVAQGGKLVLSNPMTARLLGYPSEEIRIRPFTEFIYPDDRNMVVERHLKRLRGEELPVVYSFRILNRDGNTLWMDLRAVLINWEGQAATLNFVSDITERKRAEEALRESEEKYRTLFETAGEAIFVVRGDMVVFSNPMTTRLVGYSSEEIRIRPFTEFIHPDDRNMIVERHLRRLRGEELPAVYSCRILNRDGNTLWMDVSAVLINWEGQAATLIFANDITERKRADEVIRASLREKEVLLREIHHRVKNNMQIISSLFNLQAGYIKDEEALRILKEGQTRIRSMALVHEKLYQSGDLSKIDLAGYIQSLSVHLFQVYLVDPNQVRLETEFGEVPLDINSAVPCGLILNELISNALKHAFPAGRKGVLMIRLRRRKDGEVELRIADNGVGFPKGLDFRRTEGLGLQIVNLLVGQLEGTIKLDEKNGTAFTVVFHEMKQGLRI
jgi:PAS domain S-box-containing protein